MARIFISYARKDGSVVADELADRLRAFEHEVFLDVHSIRAGTRWRVELRRRIAWANLMVVLVTPASNESEHVRDEIALAEKLTRSVLPVQINDTPMPDHLRSEWQAVKLESGNYDRVLLEIEQTLLRLPSRSSSLVLPLTLVILLVVAIAASLLSQNSQTPGEGPASISPSISASGTPLEVTYHEDFEDGTGDGWKLDWGEPFTVIDDGTGNHVWRSAGGGGVVYAPSTDWQDYALELDYYVVDWADNTTGVVLGLRRPPEGECRRYDFVILPTMLSVGAAEDNCENFNFFKQTDHASAPGVWNNIYVEARGTQLQWRLNSGPMQSYEDTRLPAGRLSILNFENSEIWFDNLRLWQFE